MKRTLIFSLAYFPHVGGAEVAIKEITDRISNTEFHMLTLNLGGEKSEEKIGNVFVHRIGGGDSYLSKILFVPRAAFAARKLHKKLGFDILWAMMSYMLFPIVLARMLGLRVRYVLTLQEGDPFKHVFNRLHILPVRWLLTAGFRNASRVTAISTFLGAWARQAGYPGDPDIIPNGVALTRFGKTVPRSSDGSIRLVTTSRLVHKNAIDDVIRALMHLPKDIRFLIYGSGPDERALKKLAEAFGVQDRTEFKGHLDHADLPAVLSKCDIFVRPSRSEGMGNSFIEAMAAGLPVIATQEGGIADFLYDAKRNPDKQPTGWAVDADSPEQIAATVMHVLENPEEAERTKVNAKRLVSEKYDWNLIAGQMDQVFERVATRI